MPGTIEISVENKLKREKRDINVYHHASRSAHIISHNSAVSLPFGLRDDDDYLHISVIRGPGHLWKECVMDLPSWADFEISAEEKINLNHSGERIFIRIPPGPPTWQLKLSGSNRLTALGTITEDYVTIADQPPEGEKKLKIKGEKND